MQEDPAFGQTRYVPSQLPGAYFTVGLRVDLRPMDARRCGCHTNMTPPVSARCAIICAPPHLAGRLDVRHEGQVNVADVIAPEIQTHLPDRLEEG